jgi:hypothetical protein
MAFIRELLHPGQDQRVPTISGGTGWQQVGQAIGQSGQHLDRQQGPWTV